MKKPFKDILSLFRYYPARTMLSLIALLFSMTTLTVFATLNGNIEHHIENSTHKQGQRLAISLYDSPIRISDWTDWQQRFPKECETFCYLTLPVFSQTENGKISSQIIALDPTSELLRQQWKVKHGRFLNRLDATNKVAMIGSDLAEILFSEPTLSAAPQWLKLNRQYYEIIGILEKREYDPLLNFDLNSSIFIPLSFAPDWVSEPRIQDFVIFSQVGFPVSLQDFIGKLIHQEFPNTKVFYKDPKVLQRALFQQANLIIRALKMITWITLLLGFLSTLNLFLILLEERKSELGIRLALGATQGMLGRQLLFETLLLCLAAGVSGIVLGEAIGIVISHYWQIEYIWQLLPVVYALSMTALVGGIVGAISAYRVTRCLPIELL